MCQCCEHMHVPIFCLYLCPCFTNKCVNVVHTCMSLYSAYTCVHVVHICMSICGVLSNQASRTAHYLFLYECMASQNASCIVGHQNKGRRRRKKIKRIFLEIDLELCKGQILCADIFYKMSFSYLNNRFHHLNLKHDFH